LNISFCWRQEVQYTVDYKQGYLFNNPTSSVRVRVSDQQAWLNIKSATVGSHRTEFEYEIPIDDAYSMLRELCIKPLIEKKRHFIHRGQHVWEIDEFHGENAGLIVAEIELAKIDEVFERPDWLGMEVTHDIRYYNNNLVIHPFNSWQN
jgi:adenylate cyclase